MFRSISSLSLLSLLAIVVLACQDTPVRKTRLTVKNTPGTTGELVLSRYHYFNLEKTVLGKTNFDANGVASLNLDVSEPSFVYYQAGAHYGGLLLEPGDDLIMSLPDRKFSGKGWQANEFITRSRRIASRYETKKGAYYGSFSPGEFQQRMDSLTAELKDFRDGFLDTADVSATVEELMVSSHDLMLLNYYQYYALVNDLEKIRSVAFLPVRKKATSLPLNNKIENSFMIEYATALQLYTDLQIMRPISKLIPEEKRMRHPDSFLKMVADTLLMSSRYPFDVKEFFLARIIDNGIGESGITPLMDSLFKVYQEQFPSSTYTTLVQKRYDKWMAIAPGRKAPDFYGLTINGDTTHLRDLHGKIVYIDVWATWCLPCIAEFPASITLRQKFEQNENIAFMYVSTDTNKDAWKKFITDNPNLKGVHVIDQNSSLSEPYLLAGVPRYILIDASGKIVNADAPRPSSGEIEALLQKLIDEN
jgi:thiol-disulfide isomerase/thioredoxin